MTLHTGKKSDSNPHLLKESFHQLQSQFIDYQCIYTDGSKEENKVGCATFTNGNCKTLRLPDGSSIFTAEAKAIDLALDFINESNLTGVQLVFFFCSGVSRLFGAQGSPSSGSLLSL